MENEQMKEEARQQLSEAQMDPKNKELTEEMRDLFRTDGEMLDYWCFPGSDDNPVAMQKQKDLEELRDLVKNFLKEKGYTKRFIVGVFPPGLVSKTQEGAYTSIIAGCGINDLRAMVEQIFDESPELKARIVLTNLLEVAKHAGR